MAFSKLVKMKSVIYKTVYQYFHEESEQGLRYSINRPIDRTAKIDKRTLFRHLNYDEENKK